MKEAPPSRAYDRKTGRCPPFQKAAGRRKAIRSSPAESFPAHSQILAKLLTSAPINFYLRAAEIRIEVLYGLGRFLRLVAWRVRRFKLHGDVRITAVAQLICEEPEEHQKVPVRQRVPEEKQRTSQRTVHSMRERFVVTRNVDQEFKIIVLGHYRRLR